MASFCRKANAIFDLPKEEQARLLLDLTKKTDVVYSLSRERMKAAIHAISLVKERKYVRRRVPKYGLAGSKAMTTAQLDTFFSGFQPHEWRWKVMFLTLWFLGGARIGEVVRINLKDIDFQNKQVFLHIEKKHYDQVVAIVLHEKLESLLLEYLGYYEREINAHEGYLFFPSTERSSKKFVGIEQAAHYFRVVCTRSGLNASYGQREQLSGLPFIKGKLYYYTPHSLRHSFGKLCADSGVPIEIAKHLLHHDSVTTTEIYYQPDKEKIQTVLKGVFGSRH